MSASFSVQCRATWHKCIRAEQWRLLSMAHLCQCCKELINGAGQGREMRVWTARQLMLLWRTGFQHHLCHQAPLWCWANISQMATNCVSFSFPACSVGNTWGQIHRSTKQSNSIWLKRLSRLPQKLDASENSDHASLNKCLLEQFWP